MMFVVDTNIIVYAANRNSPHHSVCRGLLQKWRKEARPWYLTWGIVYEFLRVVTHPQVLPAPLLGKAALAYVEALLASPGLDLLRETERHRAVLDQVVAEDEGIAGNLWFDLHTAALMREHGVRTIYTHDAHFRRFPYLEAIDPITGR